MVVPLGYQRYAGQPLNWDCFALDGLDADLPAVLELGLLLLLLFGLGFLTGVVTAALALLGFGGLELLLAEVLVAAASAAAALVPGTGFGDGSAALR
jgi:hypothetical protein